jgi:hypothetical protein
MRIEVIRDIREIKKLEKFQKYKNSEKTNSIFFERTFGPGLCYEPGLKDPPAATHDPDHVEAH